MPLPYAQLIWTRCQLLKNTWPLAPTFYDCRVTKLHSAA